jgi:Caspase domain
MAASRLIFFSGGEGVPHVNQRQPWAPSLSFDPGSLHFHMPAESVFLNVRKIVGVVFDFLKGLFIWMCSNCLCCRRSPTGVQSTNCSSPILAPIQTSALGHPDTDPNDSLHSPTSSQPPSLFALIIGINEYASSKIFNLKGAVPDALAVKTYLEDHLRVPVSQIRLLCDADATRNAIIQEFNNFVTDERIRHGDPILVFYAGHGSEAGAPKSWEAGDDKIQMLIPHDFGTVIDGRAIQGIPDRTIGTLLSYVAEKCGDNIVCLSQFDGRYMQLTRYVV